MAPNKNKSKKIKNSYPADFVRVPEITRTEIWNGPLPRPEDLSQYNQVSPGAAEKIINMASDEQAHRHDMDRSERNSANQVNQFINDNDIADRKERIISKFLFIFVVLAILSITAYLAFAKDSALFNGAFIIETIGLLVIAVKQGFFANSQKK